ncbi:MAG TPA: hypothetical protein VNQ76_03125 [Planctomicrobium sp.]|nr:hypothetical protein [Planctomicrobium sp.]
MLIIINYLRRSLGIVLIHGVLIGSVTGCSRDGPQLATVTGTITIGEQPLKYATVTFIPQGEAGAGPSSGVTDEKGKYKLGYSRDRAGAFVGRHDVTIRGLEVPDKATRDALHESGIDPALLPKVPRKYLDPGAISAEVKPHKNTIDFQLDPQSR